MKMKKGRKGLPKVRNPFVTPMLARIVSSASGRHHDRTWDVAKGRRRHAKHRKHADAW